MNFDIGDREEFFQSDLFKSHMGTPSQTAISIIDGLPLEKQKEILSSYNISKEDISRMQFVSTALIYDLYEQAKDIDGINKIAFKNGYKNMAKFKKSDFYNEVIDFFGANKDSVFNALASYAINECQDNHKYKVIMKKAGYTDLLITSNDAVREIYNSKCLFQEGAYQHLLGTFANIFDVSGYKLHSYGILTRPDEKHKNHVKMRFYH